MHGVLDWETIPRSEWRDREDAIIEYVVERHFEKVGPLLVTSPPEPSDSWPSIFRQIADLSEGLEDWQVERPNQEFLDAVTAILGTKMSEGEAFEVALMFQGKWRAGEPRLTCRRRPCSKSTAIDADRIRDQDHADRCEIVGRAVLSIHRAAKRSGRPISIKTAMVLLEELGAGEDVLGEAAYRTLFEGKLLAGTDAKNIGTPSDRLRLLVGDIWPGAESTIKKLYQQFRQDAFDRGYADDRRVTFPCFLNFEPPADPLRLDDFPEAGPLKPQKS